EIRTQQLACRGDAELQRDLGDRQPRALYGARIETVDAVALDDEPAVRRVEEHLVQPGKRRGQAEIAAVHELFPISRREVDAGDELRVLAGRVEHVRRGRG